MARAIELTSGDPDRAREAVQNAFLQLCRQKPERLGSGVKEWLEDACQKQIQRTSGKIGAIAPGEEVRWKRIAGPVAEPAAAASGPVPTLLSPQREAILRTAREAGAPKPPKPAAHPRWLLPMVGVAVAGLAAILILNRPPGKKAPVSRLPVESSPPPVVAVTTPTAAVSPAPVADALPLPLAILPFPGPPLPGQSTEPKPAVNQLAADVRDRDKLLAASPSGFPAMVGRVLDDASSFDPKELPETTPRDAISTADAHELPLPVIAGRASLGWISNSVLKQRVLPHAKAVRLEEILNSFNLRPVGTTAISKGTTLSAEAFHCPWKPSVTLLLVRFQGAVSGDREIQPSLIVDPATVSQFRLLGYSPLKGADPTTLPTHLPEKTGTTLLIELVPRASAKALGEIHWKVDGTDAAPLPIVRNPDAETSADARFAALLAIYTMWLNREQPEVIDEEFVGGLARECAAGDLPKDRSDLIVLIAKSLELR